jgi:hypothetical protein
MTKSRKTAGVFRKMAGRDEMLKIEMRATGLTIAHDVT